MTEALQIGHRPYTAEEVVALIEKYHMIPQLVRELIVDEAIASIECTPEEQAQACLQFYKQNQLTTSEAQLAWLQQQGYTPEQFAAKLTRDLKILKFKQATWGNQVPAYFLKRKGQLDQVVYSLLRTTEPGLAKELYYRIQAGEQSFAELAPAYSQGSEAETGGLIGPVSLSVPHPALAQMLAKSQVGQLWPPISLGSWQVIVRLEQQLPVQLDEFMRQRLLEELFNSWLQRECQQQMKQSALNAEADRTSETNTAQEQESRETIPEQSSTSIPDRTSITSPTPLPPTPLLPPTQCFCP